MLAKKTLTRLACLGLSYLTLAGCSHRLEIKNLSEYKPTSISPLSRRISIGILSTEEDPNLKILITQVGTELQKFSKEVILPYQPNKSKKVDLIADIRVSPEFKGSGNNFLVNFPGFLVWAPAWHGYIYTVTYNVDVNLIDPIKNDKIDTFVLPIKLDVRHAAINRTWTEVSWLEVGIIALVGGGVFTGYDPKVTPLVAKESGQTIGEYVGTEIIARINGSGRFSFLQERLDGLFEAVTG